MSICKLHDVAYVRVRVPDMEEMRRFLLDFGMVEARADKSRLFMRGHGTAPFCHVTEPGDSYAFLGLGLSLASRADLEALAESQGAAIEDLDAPGGGSVVRLTDPDGFLIEATHGGARVAELPVPSYPAWNQDRAYPRQSRTRRVEQGPGHVLRLGHVLLGVSDYARAKTWYQQTFGMVVSDDVQAPDGQAVGGFLRADRGNVPCDHHTIALAQRPVAPDLMHCAFELVDLDDLMAGHAHLKARGHRHFWGIGRHWLGSQVFDYWYDPHGNEYEHWTDGDQFVAADGGGVGTMDEMMGVQWGMPMPALA